MLHAAKEHMGVQENKYLKLVHADGLDFIRSDFNSSTPSQHQYDIIILDVAVPAKVPFPRLMNR
jgi:spermidine synthase